MISLDNWGLFGAPLSVATQVSTSVTSPWAWPCLPLVWIWGGAQAELGRRF